MCSVSAIVVVCFLVVHGVIHGHRPRVTQLRAAQLQAALTWNASTNATASPIEKQDLFGDITCMRWTGGMCRFSGCKSERGPTVCEDGMCKCPLGWCATAEGVCEQQPGDRKWSFSIKFTHPYEENFAYLSVNPTIHVNIALLRYTHATMGSSDYSSLWNVVLLPRKHVRLESVDYPGHVLTVRAHEGRVYPVLNVVEEEKPSIITFIVHETSEGALEIYHPESQLVLSSGKSLFWDSVASSGVDECSHGMSAYSATPNCDGHEFVHFMPKLPSEVVSSDSRKPLKVISPMYAWQFCAAIAFLIFICSVFRPSSWPVGMQRRHAATTASNASVASLDLLHQKVNGLEAKLSRSMIVETMLMSLTEKIDAMSEQIGIPWSAESIVMRDKADIQDMEVRMASMELLLNSSLDDFPSIKRAIAENSGAAELVITPRTDNSVITELYDIFEHSSHVGVQTDCYDIASVENVGVKGVEVSVTADQRVFRADSISPEHVNRADDNAKYDSTVLSRWSRMVQTKVQSTRNSM